MIILRLHTAAIKSQEYKSFEIDAVIIKKSMTEYNQLKANTGHGDKRVMYSKFDSSHDGEKCSIDKSGAFVYFHFFEALNECFWGAIFSGLNLCTAYQIDRVTDSM